MTAAYSFRARRIAVTEESGQVRIWPLTRDRRSGYAEIGWRGARHGDCRRARPRSVQRCRLCHAANLARPPRHEKLLRRLGEALLAGRGFEGLQGVERWQPPPHRRASEIMRKTRACQRNDALRAVLGRLGA